MQSSIKNSVNKTRVLQEIRKQSGISRIQIAKELNLDKSTISKITSDLLEQNLICDKKSIVDSNHAGRKRIELAINNQFGVVIGIEIQTEYFKTVVINLDGEILTSFSDKLIQGEFIETIQVVLDKVISSTESNHKRILGIGIGLPGNINPVDGIICQSNPLNIDAPIKLYDFLHTKYTYPIFIDNDANCCCYGELTFKKGLRDNNFLVALGENRRVDLHKNRSRSIVVGLGIVINGEVLHGDNYSAGEFKSIFWKEPNFTQFSLNNSEAEELPQNRELTLKAIDELLSQLALFVNSLNFTRVVFTGFFNDYRDDITKILKEKISHNWMYSNTPDVTIDFTPFGDFSVSYGAGGMIVERLFSLPDITNYGGENNKKGIDLFNAVMK